MVLAVVLVLAIPSSKLLSHFSLCDSQFFGINHG